MKDFPLPRSIFDFEVKEKKLELLNSQMAETNFWSDNTKAKEITKEAAAYEKILNLLLNLESELADLKELLLLLLLMILILSIFLIIDLVQVKVLWMV